jgi:diguanylate cyclase (GGDEF)-like protein
MTAATLPRQASLRLLLVEDDPRDARVVESMLRSSVAPEFEVVTVARLSMARAALDEDEFDLVVLDLGLPDSSGLSAILELQPYTADIPFILLTGKSDEKMALAALQHGAEDYLVKGDANRETILRSIRYALERHRSVRDLARVTRELQQVNVTLERLTLLDPLTELLNRRGLQQALSREIGGLSREDRDVIVLLIDIDDFKQVNDTLGLAVGDVALKEISMRLRASVRTVDYVGRLGGDEFLLILPDSNRSEVTRIAERARLAISSTRIHHGVGTVRLTASVAALLLTPDTPAIDELLARAHQLLQQSKLGGKNRVTYQPEDFDDTDRRHRRQSDMCTNLAEGRYLLTLSQPIFRLSDELPVALEFLSRYSNGHFETPDHFFRICAEQNVLTLVDHQCLRRAIVASAHHSQSTRFHLNLFPSTMISIPTEHLLEGFPHPLPERMFCIEISEQQIIGNPSYLIEPVTKLKEAGLKIAIDDVGFGNSCLESLIMLEPDVIKIDKRCVTGIDDDPTRIRYLKRYLDFARTLGAEVIAEGIENQQELDVVRDLGIEYGQGFLWGRPA